MIIMDTLKKASVNKIINRLLLAGDKFIAEMYFKTAWIYV